MKTTAKKKRPAYLPGEPVRSRRKSCSTSSRCNSAQCVRCCPDGYRESDVGGADSVLASSRRSSAKGWPGATELEYPHRVGHGRCCIHNKAWEGLDQAIADLRTAAELEGEGDDWILANLKRHPRYAQWMQQTKACQSQLEDRIARRQPLFANGEQRQRAQARAKAQREGVDVTGREYRDTLKSAESRRTPRQKYSQGAAKTYARANAPETDPRGRR